MAAMSAIRKYTDEDKARVQAAAERFTKRHGIDCNGVDAETGICYWVHNSYPEDKVYRRKLWTACYCRALRVSCDARITTGFGYIGRIIK